MKRIWQHPEEPKTSRRYWRSVNELERREDFMKSLGREFPNGDTLTDEERENSRRTFLKIMGASAGLMGLASCRRPVTQLVPFTSSVEWAVPGKSLYYATSMPRAGGATPLVVTTHDGRPTHLTGNPIHPSVQGGIDAFAQASILDMYDPDRSREVRRSNKPASWGALQKSILKAREAWGANGGEGVAILIGGEVSPTADRLRGEFLKAYPKAKFYQYEAANGDAQRSVNDALLGAGVTAVVRLDKVKRVLSLDADFLGLDPVSDDSVADFVKTRNAEKPSEADKMSRLYAIENRYTLTGAMADHRKPLAASLLPVAAALLAAKIDPSQAGAVAALIAGAPADLKTWVETAADDLIANKGSAVVLAGSRTSPAVQALAAACNNALGAYGTIIEAYKSATTVKAGTIKELQASMAAGQVKVLISFTQADPLYDAPAKWNLDKLISDKKITLVHHGLRTSATARAASWHIPAAHYLESWGDVRTKDGTYGIVQPMIQPLYDGVSELDVYLAFLGKRKLEPVVAVKPDPKAPPAAPVEDATYLAVRETFGQIAGGIDEQKWNYTLRDGFLKDSTAKPVAATVNTGAIAGLLASAKAVSGLSAQSPEIVLVPDSSVWDGRHINNGWLQEAPDPVTKLTWDNAALIGSKTFRELGLSEGSKVKITTAAGTLEIPAIEAPGHVSNSVTIQLGYGQQHIGHVGHKVGQNGYALRADADEWVITGAKLEKSDAKAHVFAITQEHNSMEGRSVYREAVKGDKDNFAQVTGIDSHIPPQMTFYKGQFDKKTAANPEGFDYENKHQWGMTIDLAKCIGCTACLIACQSENNIPIVGKDQVQKGRVMHWIRMDRYFATGEVGTVKDAHGELPKRDDVEIDPTAEQLENAEMVHQPVACQQCESAPCETVCPVNATVHTDDGLNAMAYNRCIGTRYCANNCPYTARRFNWFDYNKRPLDELYMGPLSTPEKTGVRESIKLQKNPNVTVRMRGVIEKCTYCVQRLEAAKITQLQTQRDSKNFRIPTDGVKTACQQSCPAGAIEFGDLANKDSAVNKTKASLRNYEVLKYLNTRPRTSYLARIRNINDKMPGAKLIAAWSNNQF